MKIETLADVDKVQDTAYKAGRKDLADKITDIMGEFGDDPESCLSIIGEHLMLLDANEEQVRNYNEGHDY